MKRILKKQVTGHEDKEKATGKKKKNMAYYLYSYGQVVIRL
jgi:hypothetical protein